jgi:DNA (cytosine-5)-methyltransferase 1
MTKKTIKFIDLFAGLGGTRIGFENACEKLGFLSNCVFTSEIKESAVKAYQNNFSNEEVYGDIAKVDISSIPDFDYLLAGFPCQPFSSAGNRGGFLDTRGTLFFEIEKILKAKKPTGFLLENVEGLINHDKVEKSNKTGRTLETILSKLVALGYKVSWKLIDSSDHGVPQRRKRVYIVGRKKKRVSLDHFKKLESSVGSVLEKGLKTINTPFTKKLLSHYSINDLHGKAIKDKRGGKNNIHSWDIEIKGSTNKLQRKVLEKILRERRKKHWAEKKGIVWMDGMPLTLDEIMSFVKDTEPEVLQKELDDLVTKGYLVFEHPKDIVEIPHESGGLKKERKYKKEKEKGYNIVVGKLSFEISKIIDPCDVSPTLVATDVTRLAVPDGNGLRRMTIREGLRLFGFPETYQLNCIKYTDSFDLLGNTVVVPIIEMVSKRLLA